MKTPFKTLIVLLLIPMMVMANNTDPKKYSKQKFIKKAYLVNPDAGIDINNSYGNVYVTTWNEDKIELDILIKVSSDNEEWVNNKIDDIDVDINALKHLVTAKTVIANNAWNRSTNYSTIEINYTIKIPKNGSVKLYNKYGDILTTDLFSDTNIKCQYGKITVGKLNSSKNQIDIEYCKNSSIDYAKTATISANYSGLTMNDFGNVVLKGDYTNIDFASGNNLKYDCNYGKMDLGKIVNLEGNGDYLKIKVSDLLNHLKVSTNYGKLTVENVAEKAGDILINSKYTGIEINYNPGYNFDFDINLKYGNLKYDNDLEMHSKQETAFTKSYKGYYKKSGANKVSITSEYGNVSLSKN